MLTKLFILVVAIVAGANASTEVSTEGCVLPLPRLQFFGPLIFYQNGTLVEAVNDGDEIPDIKVRIPAGQRVTLSCYPNYFKSMPNDRKLEATCKRNKLLWVNGVEKSFHKDLGCEVRAIEEVLKPVDGCSAGMESVEYGYANPIKDKSFVLGEACYDTNKGRTIFFHTKCAGFGSTVNEHLSTQSVDYFKQKHPESSYKLDMLIASRMDQLNERLTTKLGERIPFLEPRQYMDITMLPNKQYLSILKLAWNYVMLNGYDHLLNLRLLRDDIQVMKVPSYDLYMGSHGVLTLPDKNGKTVDIYLEDYPKRFPVAKYIWTVVKSENKAAAFAVLNNPDANENDVIGENLCPSKCSQMTWLKNLLLNDAYKNPKNGYVLCCSLDDFMKAIDEMPTLKGKYGLLV